jgi:hypothetical protein
MTPLGRCPYRGCAWRWRDGEDRLCGEHSGEADQRRLIDGLGLGLVDTPPLGNGGQSGDGQPSNWLHAARKPRR